VDFLAADLSATALFSHIRQRVKNLLALLGAILASHRPHDLFAVFSERHFPSPPLNEAAQCLAYLHEQISLRLTTIQIGDVARKPRVSWFSSIKANKQKQEKSTCKHECHDPLVMPEFPSHGSLLSGG
jgi:hypothetical protein